MSMEPPFTVLLPVHNEAETVGRIIERLQHAPGVAEILVVDNNSTDGSAAIAAHAGARVVHEPQPGLGAVVRHGLRAAQHDTVIKVDADLRDFDDNLVTYLANAAATTDTRLVKGKWIDPNDDMPMTRRLIQPALRHVFPDLAHLEAPNSGIYMIDRRALAIDHLPEGYAVDIDVMLRIHSGGWPVIETNIGMLHNNPRDGDHYAGMADTVFGLFLERARQEPQRLLVAIAPRSEHIVSGCLGTLSQHASVGGRVLIALTAEPTPPARHLAPLLEQFPTVEVVPPAELAGRVPAKTRDTGLTVISAAESDGFVDDWLQGLVDWPTGSLRRYALPPLTDAVDNAGFSPALSVDISPQLDFKRLLCSGYHERGGGRAAWFQRACAQSEYWGGLVGVDAAEVFASRAHRPGMPCTRAL